MKSFLAAAFSFLVMNSMAFAGPVSAYEELKAGKAVFLDVREKDEVKEGMIKDADWIPLSSLESHPAETMKKVTKTASGKKIYVYCRSGRRSQTFIDKMKESGLEGSNLGGYQDLVKAGLPSL